MPSSSRQTVTVDLSDRSYDIVIGDGVLDEAGARVAPLMGKGPRRVITVTDENVAGLHLARYRAALAAEGIESLDIILPPGEQTKSWQYLELVLEKTLAARIDRGTLMVAFGGGVIGDLAGFAAALALRGIDYVQIPTTLLAQVDSSVGGKTAIDTPQGKNLVGAFHQPKLVLADTGLLATLSERHRRAGFAEVIKYGLIREHCFYEWCAANGNAAIAGDAALLAEAVRRSCEHKADVVQQDEFETTGLRALLNLGHTFGHALEAETGYSERLLHGEAVAIGMVMAFDLSHRMGLVSGQSAGRVKQALASLGMPVDLAALPGLTVDALTAHMAKDKKVKAGTLRFVLVREIGEAFAGSEAPADLVGAVLRDAGAVG
ncbi:3-dehydroquinate synthase [Radicibacter daui]|uniref:3-dehydroquinate synthase n=1 Tax=Radicibacter daui TaxID=3064829 RepID=UPI0040469747